MPTYDKNNINELRELLFNSYVHDAELENVEYNYKQGSIKIILYNPIFNAKMDLTFNDIVTALAIKGGWNGSRETIISLTAEEDFSYLQNYLHNYGEFIEDSLYLLFQMFSGDELHIVSKKVVVETIR